MDVIESKYRKIIRKLNDKMVEKGWNCYQLSIKSGISVPMIYKIFSFTSVPGLIVLLTLAEALDLKLEVK